MTLAFQMPFYCFVQVWEIAVDGGYGQFWPCGIISFADGIDEGLFGQESRGCMVLEECFAGAWEIKYDIECLGWCCWDFLIGDGCLWVEI